MHSLSNILHYFCCLGWQVSVYPGRSGRRGRAAVGYGLFAGLGMAMSRMAEANNQSVLAPASAQAQGIGTLWWVMFWVGTIAFIGTLLVLAVGLWRGHVLNRPLGITGSRNLVVIAGVVIPLGVLLTLVGGSLMLGKELSAEPPENAITIEVTGWRWWWEVRYLDENGDPMFTTANEMHVPVGRPVALRLRAEDVIHSFWVPNLHGKTDMVPGHENTSWFQVEQAGEYRGQCAEFCGEQHALMAFLVIATPEGEFERWLANQQQPAREPDTAELRRGRDVFESACGDCHTVRGTTADGDHAPDLTHFGSRRTLGAATRPASRAHIAGWVANSQGIKPGNLMPPMKLEPEDLTAVTAYLESLK